ncbi:hypothetical protein JTB14_033214 [Gonioctena quinquepunctata]|nr:hypothetical protein JTB14_033214 [Gonioctena quinquepunctata]
MNQQKKKCGRSILTIRCTYVSGTGGGQFVPPPNPTNEHKKILADTIVLSVEGLASQFDNDAVAGRSGISSEIVLEVSDTNDDELEVDWNNPSARLWQTPKHHLITKIDFSSNVEDMVVESSSVTDDVSHPNNATETLARNEPNEEGMNRYNNRKN